MSKTSPVVTVSDEIALERLAMPAFNLTDAGNGEFIAAFFGDRYRFDHSRKRDLLFECHRWRQDVTDELGKRLA